MIRKMIPKTILLGLVGMLFICLGGSALGQMPGYPAPRYPKIPDITSVEQLMPYARFIVAKPGDKTIVMRPGYDIQGGERILMLMYDTTDPLVVEAFRRAFLEKDCQVDVLTVPMPKMIREGPVDGANEMRFSMMAYQARLAQKYPVQTKGLQYTPWGANSPDGVSLADFIAARKYDLVVGTSDSVGQKNEYLAERMNWFSREMLASPATTFPEEVLNLIDRKGWEIIRAAKSARYTDPEGTDLRWTWFSSYWQVVEGMHPHVKTAGGGPMSGQSGYAYGPGRSEDPLIPGHLMGVAEGIVLPESDAEGVIVATSNHSGPFPRIELHLKNDEVIQMTGGGEYGRLWREYLDKYKSVKYPLYPRAGVGFLMECAIGTNPKISRQYNVMESSYLKSQWVDERRRSGIVHWGLGNILRENEDWAIENDQPGAHYHLHQYFSTYEATMEDGRKVRIIEKGRLTALDDPEVRRVAAKYGDPDELLKEDWIPAIPGINAPGDYQRDYAQDPAAWITKEHRSAYPDAIAKFNQRGYDVFQ